MPAGTGRVRGEHRRRPHHRQRGVEVQPGVDQLADALDAQEAGVALVHVEHLGRGQALDFGERADGPHAADAGQDLLLDPVFLVAAVEPVGDAAQIVLVLRDVGIQQQQRNSAHLRDPDARPQLGGVRHRQLHQHRVASLIGQQPQRQALRIQRRVALVLPAVGGQRLPEVSRAVQQPHRDQRKAQIRGGLQVIAGQNAQATGIVRQHLGNAELHREVRDAVRQLRALAGLLLVPQRPGQVVVQVGGELVEAAHERLVLGQLVQPFRATCPSNATGSHPTCFHSSGSIAANRSWVGLSHDQRRLIERRSSAARRSGRCARTVNRRRAFTRLNLTDKSAHCTAVWRSLHARGVGPTTTVGIGRPGSFKRHY